MKNAAKGQRKSLRNKYLSLATMLLFCFGAHAQIIYTPQTAAGYQFKYLKVDSGFALPVRDTTIGRGVNRPGLMVVNPADSLPYYYNGFRWKPVYVDSSGIIQLIDGKVDSVTLNGNTLFYWIAGIGYGHPLNKLDSLHASNDSVYTCIAGACTFSYLVSAGTGTVTQIISGFGLVSDTITASGTVAVDTTVIHTSAYNNATYAAISHTHDASDIISGTLPIVRGGTGLAGIGSVHQELRVASVGTSLEYFTPLSVDSLTTNSDSTQLIYWINGVSHTFYNTTTGLTGGDTTVFQTVVDSTGQPGQRILWSAGNKIKSSKYLLFDSTRNKVVIGNSNISVGGTATKLYVVGNAIVNGNLTATKFIKVGGTSAQYLMADGSVTTSAGGSTTSVDSLKHLFVDTSASPRNNYVLAFDSTNHKWFLKQDSVGGGSGTVDTIHVQNMGAGTTLAYTNGSDTLFSKNIQAGSNITLTQNSDSSITIASTGGGGATDTTSLSYRINSKQSIPLINTQSLNGIYNKFDTSNFVAGGIAGQGLWTSSGAGTYTIVDSTLNLTSSDAIGAVLNRHFNEGEIILRVKTGSKFIVGYNENQYGTRWAVWTPDGTHFTFGIERTLGATIDTVAFTTLSTAASNIPSGKDYYLKLKTGAVGVANSLNWAIRDTGTATYTNGTAFNYTATNRSDTLPREGFITLGNLGTGTAKIYDIQVNDLNNPQNNLATKATFIGNWFNHYETDSNTLATITAGSEIRYNVSGATSTKISFERTLAVASPNLQPYIDVTYRDLTTGGAWSAWHRDSIGDVTYTVATGLTASHTYQIRTVFDINENDSLWTYGNGVIVRDISVNAGQIYPADISTKPLIMAIGTSLTEGANQYTYSPIGPTNNLSYNNYLHVACDSLGAIPLNQGYGATGLMKDGSGGIPRALQTLKYFKNGRLRSGAIPSLIVMEEGENDTYGGETTTNFIAEYNKVIGYLKNTYPSAQILLMRPFSGKLWTSVQSVAANNGLRTIDNSSWTLTYTDGVHLDSASQRVAGDSLYHWIRDSIGTLPAPNKNYILPTSNDYVALGVDRRTNNIVKIPSLIQSGANSDNVANNLNLSTGFSYQIKGVNVLSAQTAINNYYIAGGNSTNTGTDNSNVGYQGLQALTTGIGNSNVGSQGLKAATGASYNSNIGYNGLLNQVTGNYNTNVGYYGLKSNTVSGNTNVGAVGLFSNSTGIHLVNVGYNGLNLNSSGGNNTNVGYNGLMSVTTSGNNTNIGQNGLTLVTSADNTNVGNNGLANTTTGQKNTNVGSLGAQSMVGGSNNVTMGYQVAPNLGGPVAAGAFVVGGGYKIATVGTTDFTLIGSANNTVGTTFTATGVGTGTGTATPTFTATDNNTIIGGNATGGGLNYGANNTIIGAGITGLPGNLSNNVIIGDGSGNIRIQTTSIGVTNFFKGANVASASAIVPTGNLFHVTGTTTITSITATNVNAGARITIIFDGALTFTDGSNLKLAGNFTTSADATITLVYDGTNFYETSRSVN